MFNGKYFGTRYFADRYWPKAGNLNTLYQNSGDIRTKLLGAYTNNGDIQTFLGNAFANSGDIYAVLLKRSPQTKVNFEFDIETELN
jgi:hypothetical protein